MRDIRPPTPEELSAYTDGELDADRQAEIALYLSQRDDHDALMSADSAILGGLRSMREKLSPAATPARLRDAVSGLNVAGRIERYRRAVALLGAAAAVAVVMFAISIVSCHDLDARDKRLAEQEISEAASYYLRDVNGATQFGAQSDAELITALPQLSGEVVKARFMTDTDFEYLGGRVLSRAGEGAAILFYQDQQGAFYGLTIWRESPTTSSAPIATGPGRTLFWNDKSHRFALTAASEDASLDEFKEELRRRYNGRE